MWKPCVYDEWERDDPFFMVCAMVHVLHPDGTTGIAQSMKWIELGDEPGEQAIAHEMIRFLAFQEAEDG